MLRCGLCMGYGARARVQVGIRTEVEPVWGHTPSLAPISLPSAALGLLPCAHLAQRSAIPRSKTEFYTPFCGTVPFVCAAVLAAAMLLLLPAAVGLPAFDNPRTLFAALGPGNGCNGATGVEPLLWQV